ncbi:hypothetical protein ACFLQ0_01010 [Nitrospinota bacterium]
MKCHIAFLDILGLRFALASGEVALAESKVVSLASIVEKVVNQFPGLRAHGATDFFLLWADDSEKGWHVALAAAEIFRCYFDLNQEQKIRDITDSYMLRGGLAYGQVDQRSMSGGRVSYSLTLGDGVARAYEVQAADAGMRLFLDNEATRYFRPLKPPPGWEGLSSVKVDRTHGKSGEISSREIRWGGTSVEAEARLLVANRLFRRALISWKKGQTGDRVVSHYQQTLCALLGSISNPDVIRRYLTYRFNARRYHQFLFPVWATAWIRLFRPKHLEVITDLKEELLEKFLLIAPTGGMTEVASALGRYNRMRPLMRFLKTGKLRMRPRNR